MNALQQNKIKNIKVDEMTGQKNFCYRIIKNWQT